MVNNRRRVVRRNRLLQTARRRPKPAAHLGERAPALIAYIIKHSRSRISKAYANASSIVLPSVAACARKLAR